MRRGIAFMTAAGLALTLAACGDDSDDETTGSDTTADTTDEGTTDGEETTDGESEAPVDAPDGTGQTITIWVDDTRDEPVQAAADRFTEDTGAQVEIVQKEFGSINNEFTTQVPSGEGPDLTIGAHDWLGSLVTNGVVAPIELGDNSGDFNPVAIEAFTYDGQVYGLPYAVENIAIIRNADLVDETPATFDEMIEMGKGAGTEFPFLVQTGETGDPYTYYPFQTSFGAPVFEQNEDGTYNSTLTMGGENGEAFAAWLAEQGSAGVLDPAVTYDIAVEQFKNGNAPYLLGGPWMLADFEGMNLSIDPIPSAGGEEAQPFVGVQGVYMNAQSENQLLASYFLLNYIADEEIQVAMYEAGDRIPALTAAAEQVAEDPIPAGFLAVSEGGVPMPSIPEMGAVWNYWGSSEAQIITGEGDPAEVWNKMISDIEGDLG